jgi:hypothetical protein
LVTLPVAPLAAEGAEEAAAGAEPAGALGGAEVAGAEVELAPELQAAAPATRQAPTAAMRHR